jgi:hypothetical protein
MKSADKREKAEGKNLKPEENKRKETEGNRSTYR